MPPTITSPLRLLLLSTPSTPHPSIFNDTTHHPLHTPYYTASIPIWRDILPTTPSTLSAWKAEWTGPAAGEVVQALGAWVVCFKKPRVKDDLDVIRDLLKTIKEVVEHHHAGDWDGDGNGYGGSEALLLAVGMQQSVSPSLEIEGEEWEDLCRECGAWEWIDGEIAEPVDVGTAAAQKNDFGEKVGIARLKEALEAHEWDSGGADADVDGLEEELGFEDGFGAEAAEVEREMVGLKMAVRREGVEDGEDEEEEGGDEGVEELENMMLKMQAIKDLGADMPEGERRKFAARAVRDVMKTM